LDTTPGGRAPRFPGFDSLSQVKTWDRVTAGVVLARLAPPPPLRFFDREHEPTARALVDRLLALEEPRVPVVEMIDARLVEGKGDGYRYDDMPEDPEAWVRSVANLDADARDQHGRPFWDLSPDEQGKLVEAVRTTGGDWRGMPAKRVWSLWTRYTSAAFYSHPWAWNEIGFGGPAYPRGYKNIGIDRREPWEVADQHNAAPRETPGR
jgi:hypothetical protein